MITCIVIIPVLDAQLVLSILFGFSNPHGILLGKPQADLRSQHIPTVSAGKTPQLQPPTICGLAFCTRKNIKFAQRTQGVPLAAVQGAGSCIMSSSGPSARDSPFIQHSMHKLETGQAVLLAIGDQGQATPAHAADVNAFLVIASLILQTQSIVDMCFFEGQRQVRVL
jgi:hypothetical protein